MNIFKVRVWLCVCVHVPAGGHEAAVVGALQRVARGLRGGERARAAAPALPPARAPPPAAQVHVPAQSGGGWAARGNLANA